MNKSDYLTKPFAILLMLMGFACTNFSTFDRTDYDSIAFGTYCGECNGQCFQGYYLKNDNVYRIGLPDNNLENVNFDTISDKTQLDKTESEKIQAILKLLPGNIESYNKTIGNPDNQDQCGISLFLDHKSHQTKIQIDMDKRNCPAKLSKFIEAVSSLKLL